MNWVVVNEKGFEERFSLPSDECPFPWGCGVAIVNPTDGVPTAFWNVGIAQEIRRDPLPAGGAHHYQLIRLNNSTIDLFTEDYSGLQPYKFGIGEKQLQHQTSYVTVTQPGPLDSKYRDVLLIARLEGIRSLRKVG
jgi:hypothetical protein